MADIVVNYNQDILRGTLEALEASDLKTLVQGGMKVAVKPNMVLPKLPSTGTTTHSEVVEGLICYLKDIGIREIEIIESSGTGSSTKQAYHVCGYDELSKKYNVPLIDLKEDEVCTVTSGEYDFRICKKALEADFLINVPVLKAHCMTLMTCCLKNLKGCIPDTEKRRFHTLGLHRPIAFLNKALKANFNLVDGICGDLTFEEGGNPVTRNMIIAGQDSLLVDSYCAELIGYQVSEIEYLNIAAKLDIGKLFDSESDIIELNEDNKPKFTGADSALVKQLASHVLEDQACSACYAALIYALHNTKDIAKKLGADKINIGQGFRGKFGKLGCGNCAGKCDKFVMGCPPKATEVAAFLREL